MNYAQVFKSILKESIKRTTNSKLGLHSRKVTYCPVPETFMALSAVQTATKEDEVVMRDWIENLRAV